MKYFSSRWFLFALINLLIVLISADAYAQPGTRAEVLRGAIRPERDCYDVTRYDLTIKVDTSTKSIEGSNKITFHALRDFSRLQVDLFANMKVDKILFNGAEQKFTRDFDAVFIDLDKIITQNTDAFIEVFYSGKPIIAKNPPWDGGFTWTKDQRGKPWISVSCQGIGASLWWPNKDHQSDEPETMTISCIVPGDLRCVSNGRETAVEKLGDFTRYEWTVSYPINNYNVSVNIGDYVHWHDVYQSPDGDTLSLDYYILRDNLNRSKKHFEQVKPMLACYEKYLGKYPFWRDGYALVETPFLGMEHQGAIAYGNKFKQGYDGMDRSGLKLPFDYIIIHETGHEWWGNSVTAADIADMWIHESFCTYSEAIYAECMYGYDTAMSYVNAMRSTVSNKTPIVGTYGLNREGHSDMYVKGMLFLNTLRHVIDNDEIWWPMIKNMSDTTFKYRITDYDEVVSFFNQKTGMNLSPLFEQYVKNAGLPRLQYCINKKGSKYTMKYRWETPVKEFAMPVDIYDGDKKIRITPNNSWQKITLKNDVAFDEKRYYYKKEKQ